VITGDLLDLPVHFLGVGLGQRAEGVSGRPGPSLLALLFFGLSLGRVLINATALRAYVCLSPNSGARADIPGPPLWAHNAT
jgi:hypothetical protein